MDLRMDCVQEWTLRPSLNGIERIYDADREGSTSGSVAPTPLAYTALRIGDLLTASWQESPRLLTQAPS